MLVLKHILGGSLKTIPENSNNLARQKIANQRSLWVSDNRNRKPFCNSRRNCSCSRDFLQRPASVTCRVFNSRSPMATASVYQSQHGIVTCFCLRAHRSLQGSKSPKSGKEGSGAQKLPFPLPQKRAFRVKKSHFSTGHHKENGDFFDLNRPGAMGNGSFWTPKPSFPNFGDFDPRRGSKSLQVSVGSIPKRPRDFGALTSLQATAAPSAAYYLVDLHRLSLGNSLERQKTHP